MLRFYADEFCRAASLLGQIHNSLTVGRVAPNNDSWAVIAGALGGLEKHCEKLGLVNSLAQVRRLKPLFTAGKTTFQYDALARDLLEVEIRLNDELSSRLMLAIAPENADLLLAFGPDSRADAPVGPEIAWASALEAFPSVKFDIVEALKTYALDRSTACVFHLMRALEIGLSLLGSVFGVSLAHTNWGPAIEQIEKRIRGMHTDPAWNGVPNVKEKQEAYAQAAGYLGIAKDAWRNHTAHARSKYTGPEASDIMTGVRAFLCKLAADGVKEPQPVP
jgi:hypothetical protein